MHNLLDHVPDQTVESKLENLSSMDCVAIDDSLSQDNTVSCDSCVLIKGSEFTSKHRKMYVQNKCPLSHTSTTSLLCDHNGGVLISKDGDLKVTIPEGAIKDDDLVTLSTASHLYGPFLLPPKYQAGVVSPYYWIGVSESYHFQKPVQVEFQHFAVVTACDPSHYQLWCCEDDDESYTMRQADGCSLEFTVQDDISWCTFYTDHFCSYCLLSGCEDPIINRIAAICLKSKDSQRFTREIWFSFPINQCFNRNKELYTKRGMVEDDNCKHIFEAPCDKSSTKFFALVYCHDFDGWDVKHCRSEKIKTKEINFYNHYKTMEELKTIEDNSLFPPRFIITVTKKSECNADLNTEIKIALHENEGEILESIQFPFFISMCPFVANRFITGTLQHKNHKHM